MKVEYLPVARRELLEAITYYDRQRKGVGADFRREFDLTLKRIGRLPEAWHSVSLNTRRCRLDRFPYGIIYQFQGNRVLIISVSHLKRHPDHWKDRI